MENLEQKLDALMNDPDMMQKIQSIAQSLNLTAPPQGQDATPPADLSFLNRLSGMAGESGVDQQQQALLKALEPYLSQNRISKLENAMRAAKMARLASCFLGSGGLQLLSGR